VKNVKFEAIIVMKKNEMGIF